MVGHYSRYCREVYSKTVTVVQYRVKWAVLQTYSVRAALVLGVFGGFPVF